MNGTGALLGLIIIPSHNNERSHFWLRIQQHGNETMARQVSLLLLIVDVMRIWPPKAAFTPGQHVARTSNMLPSTYMLTATCCPATSCSFGIQCFLYIGNIITIHLCHGRLDIPLYPARDGQQTDNNFVADKIYKQLGHMLPGNMLPWCKRGLRCYGI